jgi:hypothetical protein
LATSPGFLFHSHVGVQCVQFFSGHDFLLGFGRQLNLNNENNIPTWYSSSALLLSAMLLTVIGLAKKQGDNPYAFHWLGLAGIFFYLSLDEAASLHEMTMPLLKPLLKADGYIHGLLYYPWVILGAIFMLIIALAYLRFLTALPLQTKYLFVTAGTLYVGGALGIEILGARYNYIQGTENFTYAIFVVAEEGFEMIGIVIFIYALLCYLGSSLSSLRILFSDERPNTAAIAVELSYPEGGRKIG